MPYIHYVHAQASLIAEELLKSNPDVVRIIFNKFRSAISFKPTIATVLMPEVSWKLLLALWFAGGAPSSSIVGPSTHAPLCSCLKWAVCVCVRALDCVCVCACPLVQCTGTCSQAATPVITHMHICPHPPPSLYPDCGAADVRAQRQQAGRVRHGVGCRELRHDARLGRVPAGLGEGVRGEESVCVCERGRWGERDRQRCVRCRSQLAGWALQ